MSNTGKFKDRTPFLRVAGITSSVYGASVDQSLRQDLYYQVNIFKKNELSEERIKFFLIKIKSLERVLLSTLKNLEDHSERNQE